MSEPLKVVIQYKNYRDEVSWRVIRPSHIYFGATEYHREQQWILLAFDYSKDDWRSFAMKDILSWRTMEGWRP